MRRIISTLLLILMLLPMTVQASEYTDKNYIHDERFNDYLIVNGIDASYYQDTSSDWHKAKADGIDFAILRVTLTKSVSGAFSKDENFETHFKNAGEAGMMRGVYVFSQAKNAEEGKAEAEYAISRLQELNITPDDLDLPVYMDYEFHHKEESRLRDLSSNDAISAAESFCDTVKSYGYKAGIYANTSFFASYLKNGTSLPEDISLWCAQYNSQNNSGSDYEIWQYSSSGIVPNIYEHGSKKLDGVDVDFWYVDTRLNYGSELKIRANTNVEYTGEPVLPDVEIYDGKKRLKENKDYVVKGINNIEKNADSYAYIRGIGKYDGYALVPINIGEPFVTLNLPASVIDTYYTKETNETGTYICDIPDGITVEEFLAGTFLTTEEYRLNVIDANGNEKMGEDELVFSDMLGIFSETSLVGTIDLNLDCENQINYLFKK